jgi:aspartokinase-like uncharacterized kinase
VTPFSLVVIKVGGSLFDWPDLPVQLATFLEAHVPSTGIERPLLIAGGGRAADLVRDLDRIHQLGDEMAHQLAFHTMDLTARLLSALLPRSQVTETLNTAWQSLDHGIVPVLAPWQILRAIDEAACEPLPASWAVTSDSIAARIAAHVNASRLILLKSASIANHATRQDAARAGLVDPHFPAVARALSRVEYLNLRDPDARVEILSQ